MPTLAEVVAAVHATYDPRDAEPWDAVGLVCGDPDRPVRRVHLAVDPVEDVAAEALAAGADLLITHHPLYLRGTTTVAADTPKGRVVHALVSGGCGLLVAHTNADVAPREGVSDALATRLGLHDVRPLRPSAHQLDQLAVYVPEADAERLVDALAAAGAGRLGDYERCAFSVAGEGTFTPLTGARPAVGVVGVREHVAERRVEMVLTRDRREAVLASMRAAHPYEEPAFALVELAGVPGRGGLGRVGRLAAPTTLAAFTEHVAAALPATVWGVRAAGNPAMEVYTVAVCGGSGGELTAQAAAAGADVLVTADLRHHTASESLVDDGVALVDAAHWATERPWLDLAAGVLRRSFGDDVECVVSELRTDPWTVHATPPEEPA